MEFQLGPRRGIYIDIIEEMKSGGYGISLMKQIMDSISYSSNIYGVQPFAVKNPRRNGA